MKAVVLAAGKGSRLIPLTRSVAKPMMTVANYPVMEHIIIGLCKSGFHEILSNLYYSPSDMIDYFGDGSEWGVSIIWRTEAELTGPAGGVATFADLLGDEDDILVVSGDALHDVDLRAFVEFHKGHDALLSVVMKRVLDPGRYGVGAIDANNRIIQFKEKPLLDLSNEGLVSCGIYCLSSTLLKRIPKGVKYDFGADIIPMLAANGEAVFCFEIQSYWRDIGSITELRLANLDAISGRVKIHIPGEIVREGVYIEHGAILESDVEIVPPVLIGKNAMIARGVKIVGPSVLGSCVVVREGAYISNAVLLKGTDVLQQVVIVDGLVGTTGAIHHL